MAQGGNTFEKYEKKRRIDGKLCLEDATHDTVCRLIAEGTVVEDIPDLLDGEISVESIREKLNDWRWERRIAYLKRQVERESFEPTTSDECLKFVKQRLVALSKSADSDKSKIDALKALASVAIDERKQGTSGNQIDQSMLEKLAKGDAGE